MVLFSIGSAAVLLRRNAIVVFMGVELMLNADQPRVRQLLAACTAPSTARCMAFFVMVVAAAEVVVGLAIIMAIFRARGRSRSTTPTC